MNSSNSRPQGRRGPRGGRRRFHDPRRDSSHRTGRPDLAGRAGAAPRLTLWQKVIAFFTGGLRKQQPTESPDRPRPEQTGRGAPKPERIEVTSPRLYVGNLSYHATESDLYDLFNGVGTVQNAEIVTHRDTDRSKGFGFVTMLTVDEAKRAVETLHDKAFMGRNLVVTGSKSDGPRS